MGNYHNNLDLQNLNDLTEKELYETNGGCKEWLLLFGLVGVACYAGWHDASDGKHEK